MGGAGELVLDLVGQKELARHIGQFYTLDPVHYVGTPPMITALANDQIEIANLAYSTLGIAVQNAGLDDMRSSPTSSRTASTKRRFEARSRLCHVAV